MIVASRYDADEDSVTQWMQHDAYDAALGIIVRGCRGHARNAAALLGVERPPGWMDTDRLDHRTLQDAHDLLAAAWRFHADTLQPMLPLRLPESRPADPVQAWLGWLRAEVHTWHERPLLVRLLLAIVANQNQQDGYAAEEALALELRTRFADVPWTSGKNQPGCRLDASRSRHRSRSRR